MLLLMMMVLVIMVMVMMMMSDLDNSALLHLKKIVVFNWTEPQACHKMQLNPKNRVSMLPWKSKYR